MTRGPTRKWTNASVLEDRDRAGSAGAESVLSCLHDSVNSPDRRLYSTEPCSAITASSADRAVGALPELRAHRLLVGLAQCGHRHRLDNDHLLGRLHRALALLHRGLDLGGHLRHRLLIRRRIRPQHYHRRHRLAPLLVRGTDHAYLRDG